MFENRTALRLCIFVTALLYPFCASAQDTAFELFAAPDVVRVFEDGYNCPEPQDAIEIFGIRNETLSAQCVVKAARDLKRVTVSVSPLVNAGRNVSLPPDAITWNFVGSIAIAENTPKIRKTDIIRPAPARFPDYLAEDKSISIEDGKYRGIFLTIKIPRDAADGMYEGTVTVETEQGGKSLPVRVTVYPLILPDERHLMVTEWYSTGRFRQFHGINSSDSDEFYRMLGIYAQNMAEHRQNVFRLTLDLVECRLGSDAKLTFYFSRFDKWADIFWNTGGMDLLETGFVARFGEGGWSSNEVLLRDFRVQEQSSGRTVTMPGEKFLPQFLPAFENHLREKGWLDKTVFHIADEPSNHNIISWRKASQFVHEHAPALRRMDAIETPHCDETLEIWVPKLDHFDTWYDAYKQAQSRGYELWFYTVGIFQKGSLPNKTADVALIESRLLHWLNYRFGATGYLHWGLNAWTDDPFEAPGQHRGDGWHVYPKKDGLLNSLRWEQMRNGIQDYEYFRMLEDKIAEIKSGIGENSFMFDPTKRGVEIASQVLRTMSDFSRNPKVLYAAKKQIVDELLDFDRPPKLIVQTGPLEHSVVANDAAIDLCGWAETGTKIKVNGRQLQLSPDGLFMENVSLSRDHTIVVEAEHEKGSKKIVRSFEVLYQDR